MWYGGSSVDCASLEVSIIRLMGFFLQEKLNEAVAVLNKNLQVGFHWNS